MLPYITLHVYGEPGPNLFSGTNRASRIYLELEDLFVEVEAHTIS